MLIELYAGDRARRDEIQRLLGTEKHSTSTHVLREWKRVADGTAVEMLTKRDVLGGRRGGKRGEPCRIEQQVLDPLVRGAVIHRGHRSGRTVDA